MANYLTASEVIAEVKRIEDDAGMKALRNDVLTRLSQHAGTKDPWLPEHFILDGKTVVASFRIQDLAQKLMAFMGAYPTTTAVTPGDAKQFQTKADEAEKRLALVRTDLFPDEKRAEMRWWQLIGGYGVYKLVCKPNNAGDKPWSVEVCDPESTFFTLQGAPIRPSIVGRRYTMKGREIKASFGKSRDTNGIWGVEPMSVDVYTDGQNNTRSDSAGQKWLYEDYEVVELDTGECTYTVVKSKDGQGVSGQDGQEVNRYENLVGGTHYVIVPGHVTGSREPREHILPYLWGPMNVVDQLTLIRTMRATNFTSKQFKILVERNPDFFKAGMDVGALSAASQAAAGDDVFEFNGKTVIYERPKNEDMDLLEQALEREYAEMASTQLSVTTADVVKEGTLGAQQIAVGQREKQQAPMLSFEDTAEQMILEMVVKSLTHKNGYVPTKAEGWGYYGSGGERYGKGEIEPGTKLNLTKEIVDFEMRIRVSTASRSDEQRQNETLFTLQLHQVNFATTDDVLTAMGIQDIAGWHEAKAEDDAIKAASKLINDNFYLDLLQKMLLTDGGVNIQLPGMVQPVQTTDVANPNAPRPVPATEGVGNENPAGEFAA